VRGSRAASRPSCFLSPADSSRPCALEASLARPHVSLASDVRRIKTAQREKTRPTVLLQGEREHRKRRGGGRQCADDDDDDEEGQTRALLGIPEHCGRGEREGREGQLDGSSGGRRGAREGKRGRTEHDRVSPQDCRGEDEERQPPSTRSTLSRSSRRSDGPADEDEADAHILDTKRSLLTGFLPFPFGASVLRGGRRTGEHEESSRERRGGRRERGRTTSP